MTQAPAPRTTRRVLLVGHDRGGTNLLVPLLRRWRAAGSGIDATFVSTPIIEYEVGGMLDASPVGGRDSPLAIRTSRIEGRAGGGMARPTWTLDEVSLDVLLAEGNWDIVITGTSALSTMEKTVWKLCRRRAIACTAICDMWTEYHRRFEDETGAVALDHLLAVDTRMAHDIQSAFSGRVRTTVTGNPHFAELLGRRGNPAVDAGQLRFISEPANALFPEAHVHEFDVAKSVIEARDRSRPDLPLVIRPHPQDDSEGWRRFVFANRAAGVRLDADPSWMCAGTTSMAVGLSSMMLIELAIAGVPAASFRPAGANPAYFCLNEAEFGIAIIHDVAGLAKWIAAPGVPVLSPSVRSMHGDSIDEITARVLAGTLIA